MLVTSPGWLGNLKGGPWNQDKIYVDGGGSIAPESYHLGLITNVASETCVVYIHATMRSGMGQRS